MFNGVECKQNALFKPFEWANLTVIIQFDFCPKCIYFKRCYDFNELADRYDGKAVTVRGTASYLSNECGLDLEDGEA